ncbi:hypothetical protein AB4Z54_71830, partial [Streptomyces sp. MCAF7]
PGPGKMLSARDVCPDTGLARLSYGQARALLDQHTALAGPGTGSAGLAVRRRYGGAARHWALYLVRTHSGMPILWAPTSPKLGEREVLAAMSPRPRDP